MRVWVLGEGPHRMALGKPSIPSRAAMGMSWVPRIPTGAPNGKVENHACRLYLAVEAPFRKIPPWQDTRADLPRTLHIAVDKTVKTIKASEPAERVRRPNRTRFGKWLWQPCRSDRQRSCWRILG